MENQRKCNGCGEIKSIRRFDYCGECCNALARKKYHQNKEERLEKMKEYNSQQVECECGCVVQYGSMSEHKKTEKHIHLMETKQQVNERTKRCSICKEVKDKSQFSKSCQTKDGFSYRCKICDKERKKAK